MHKRVKQSIVLFILISFVSGTPVFAQGPSKEPVRSAEKMAVDAVFLRPAGLLATVIGALTFGISLPFSALGGNTGEAYDALVKKPARYTFKRPLGEF